MFTGQIDDVWLVPWALPTVIKFPEPQSLRHDVDAPIKIVLDAVLLP